MLRKPLKDLAAEARVRQTETGTRIQPRRDRVARFMRRFHDGWIRGRLMRLQTILSLAFAIITIIPVLTLAIWMDRSALRKEQEAVQEKHLLLARTVSSELSRYATEVTSAFRLAIRQNEHPQVSSDLTTHLASLGIRCVFHVPDKLIKVDTWICPEPAFDPGNLDAVIEQAKAQQLTFSDVQPDGQGRPTIYLVANNAGEPPAVAAIATDHFRTIQQAITFGESGYAAIVDRAGTLLAHPHADVAGEIRDMSDIEPVRRMIGGETGIATFYSPIKMADMIAGYTVTPAAGWGVMVAQPVIELQRRAADGRVAALAITIAGILVAAFASWLFARYLTGSIAPIVEAAKANADGRFGTESRTAQRFMPSDLRELATSFNVMAREIRASYRRQQEALQATRRAEEDCRGIFEHATEGIFRSSPDGKLIRANPALAKLHGYETEEELLAALNDLSTEWYVEPGRRELFRQLLEQQGAIANFVSELHRHKTGERIWVCENARAIYDSAETLLHFEGTVIDITERIQAEEANHRAIAAESANRTKSQFLATLSHELRTPLNAIIGFSEIMERGTFGPLGSKRYLGYARDIHESGLHLLTLINELLDFSKIESKKYELHDEIIDLASLIPDVVRLLEPDAAKERVEIKLEIEDRLPLLLADSRATKQILLNLLSNAVKFTTRNGRVTVKAYHSHGAIKIYVKDNGIGIEPQNIQKVLTPFGQVEDRLTKATTGTGLGLPIVKSLIELHGGNFQLGSKPGSGTKAIVAFPTDRSIPQQTPEDTGHGRAAAV